MHNEGSERWQRADESVAARFSMSWNAATSRWGIAGDLVVASGCSALAALLLALAVNFHLRWAAWVLGGLAIAPLAVYVVVNVRLRDGRRRVVSWLAGLPFPVENMNSLLAGFGEEFEVYFVRDAPGRQEVMEHLERVSEDVFVLETHEDQNMIRARLGVIVSKHNPRQAHLRFARFTQVVERSLIPLHEAHPIERVLLC